MDFPNAGDTAAQRVGKVFRSLVSDEPSNGFGRSGQGPLLVFSAPILKRGEICSVAAERVFGIGTFQPR
jgi:hypothetical protein